MEQPPTYNEATSQDGWGIAAPYIDLCDYHSLCLVSREMYARFAPRLWRDPLQMATALKLDPGDHYRWFCYFLSFITRAEHPTRDSTLAMPVIIDLRPLWRPSSAYSGDSWPSLAQKLYQAVAKLPNLRCLILDGRADFNFVAMQYLVLGDAQRLQGLRLLSTAHCKQAIPARFFDGRCLAGLAFLDLSHTGGWSRVLLWSETFSPVNLPSLHVLKLRGKGMDRSTALVVVMRFQRQLWSLDLSGNQLADDSLDDLVRFAVRPDEDRGVQRPEAELLLRPGTVAPPSRHSSEAEGTLRAAELLQGHYFVDESGWSATFSHPDRYLADPPGYAATAADDVVHPSEHQGRQNRALIRGSGAEPVRGDSAEDAIRLLAGRPGSPLPPSPDMPHRVPGDRGGLTHVYLNDLSLLTTKQVTRFLATSAAFLEHFEFNKGRFPVSGARRDRVAGSRGAAAAPSRRQRITSCIGFPGGAYLFRPVYSPNLRALKIHHSLVTNVLTVRSDEKRVLDDIRLAETQLRRRLDLAFPQRFVPDMNPRINALTLCYIPRHSSGAVTERLVELLRLAALQEQTIAQTSRACRGHRGPPVLRGLRHITLEFDPLDEGWSYEPARAWDEDDDEMLEFSSFSAGVLDESLPPAPSAAGAADPVVSSPPPPPPPPPSSSQLAEPRAATAARRPRRHNAADTGGVLDSPFAEHLIGSPYDDTQSDYHLEHTPGDGGGGDGGQPIPVWIGCGITTPDTPPAINAYMRNLCEPGGRGMRDVMAATPCHVAAGVPPGSYIFGAAWEMMVTAAAADSLEEEEEEEEEKEEGKPAGAAARAGPGGMRDVLEEIKAFRLDTRARYTRMREEGRITGRAGEHSYWMGRLDIVVLQRDQALWSLDAK